MKFKTLYKKKREGFTLVEMVIVVTILGILSGIGFMQFGNIQEASRKNADYVAAANLATAASLYISEHPESGKISESETEKIIPTNILKEKGYINYIPKSQSTNKAFIIKIAKVEIDGNKSEELRVLCNLGGEEDHVFYPKLEEK